MSKKEFEMRRKEARWQVDEYDEATGWTNRRLSRILELLEAGLKDPKTGAAFNALVMLENKIKAGAK